MAVDEKRINDTMERYGVNRDEALFIIDLEDGAIDGDVVYVKGNDNARPTTD